MVQIHYSVGSDKHNEIYSVVKEYSEKYSNAESVAGCNLISFEKSCIFL
jgi:hypothetical protein